MLILCACSSAHRSVVSAENPSAQLVPQKLLFAFHDAVAADIDQFQNVYVVESKEHRVIKLSPKGDSLREVSGFGQDHYQFNGPSDVDARLTNRVFIADKFNHRIEEYTKDLTYISTLYTRENSQQAKRFGYPTAVATDDAGNIYVADAENKRVAKFRADFSFERSIGGYSEASRPEAILTNPSDMVVDRDQHLIVLDNNGTSLVTYDNLGNFIARIALEEAANSITTANDLLYVPLANKNMVLLFTLPRLEYKTCWSIDRQMLPSSASVRSVVGPYLLTNDGLYSCKVFGKDPSSEQ